jgi:hypothetical protein
MDVGARPRRFGVTTGLAFLALAGASWMRGHVYPPRVLAVLGATLLLGGVVAPALLVPVERVWMRGALVLARVNMRVVLTVVFYAMLTPIGVVRRWFADPLNRAFDHDGATQWRERPREPADLEHYERQF